MTKTKLITAPAATAVTLTEAKAHLRVDFTTDDTLITTLINVATEWVEERLAKKLITQTWEYYLDEFPSEDSFKIPFPPLQSITSIKYYDEANALQTLPTSDYDVDTIAEPGCVIQSSAGTGWKTTYNRPNAVIVKFVAGFGSASTNVPELIRAAVKLMISHFYENREALQTIGNVGQIPVPKAVEDLLNQTSVRQMI